MATNWYFLSLTALLLMGSQRFLYKVSAERGCNTGWTTLVFMATVAVLSSLIFFVAEDPVPNISTLFLVSIINAGAFLAGTVSHIEALKHLPATIAYPIIRLNVVLVILFSVIYFGDDLSGHQITGIILALMVIALLATEANDQKTSYNKPKQGFFLIGIAVLCGALASISSKFAALYTSKLGFMAVSYCMATVFSFFLQTRKNDEETGTNRRDAVIIGLVMGATNFVGFYAFLQALSYGPLSLIAPITGMHFVIAIIFSVLIYKERLTATRIAGVALTILSIIFLRM